MKKPVYSVIIPVYNRPGELDELLDSLTQSEFTAFEVLVVEDGSQKTSRHVVEQYSHRMSITYIEKDNTGQGFSRNLASEKANGEFLVFFDSDCLIPPYYFDKVEDFRKVQDIDFWGGPDDAHKSFTLLQKAISYTMTSFLTTGGIRGAKEETFQPRTFNMGIRKSVFLAHSGFHQTNLGEDVELSTRLAGSGVKGYLIREAKVYHKRRNSPTSFFFQMIGFGKGRALLSKKKGGIKPVHWLPAVFTAGWLGLPISFLLHPLLFQVHLSAYGIYLLLLFFGGTFRFRNPLVGMAAMFIVILQFGGYSVGFIKGMFGA